MLKALAEKCFKEVKILALWIDGIQLGGYNVVCAVGVDPEGRKYVMGLREGATENAEVVKSLLEDLVARGLDPRQRRLFILDVAKLLPPSLSRCLVATNCIYTSHSAARHRKARVKHWQSGEMAVRWMAVAFELLQRGFEE